MRIKDGFVVTDVGNKKVAVPVGKAAEEVKGIIRLNETGFFIWEQIDKGLKKEEIATKMTEKYCDLNYQTALSCTEEIIAKLEKDGILEY